jgi:zinc transport system substrate-binding protein
MKKMFFRTILVLLFLSAAAPAVAVAAKIPVCVSILPQAFFVERIAGERAAVHVMIPKGASPETYEPTPQQLVALSNTGIYVKVGVPDLPFEEKILRAIGDRNRKMAVVNMSDGVTLRKEDPHVWTSPAASRIAARNIAKALIAYDPDNKPLYESNLQNFLREIDALDQEIRRTLSGKKGYAFMVYHPAWGYFAADYGLVQLAVEEEGKPTSAAHIRKMIDLARSKGIRAIFVQKGFDTKSARAIAREIGGEVVEADPLERDWLAGIRSFTASLTRVLRK